MSRQITSQHTVPHLDMSYSVLLCTAVSTLPPFVHLLRLHGDFHIRLITYLTQARYCLSVSVPSSIRLPHHLSYRQLASYVYLMFLISSITFLDSLDIALILWNLVRYLPSGPALTTSPLCQYLLCPPSLPLPSLPHTCLPSLHSKLPFPFLFSLSSVFSTL